MLPRNHRCDDLNKQGERDDSMHDGSAWILGFAMAVLAVLGLIIAGNATDTTMYYAGLGLCLFGVLFNYGMVARRTGKGNG